MSSMRSADRSLRQRIRCLLEQSGALQVDLASLGDESDLYSAGLTSHATVGLMLAIEDEFDIEFPDRLLRRRTFYSVKSLAEALAEICGQEESA